MGATTGLSRELPAPEAPASRRRRTTVLLAAVVALLMLVVVAVLLAQRGADVPPAPEAQLPPAGQGLLPWPPRGALATDADLIASAVERWQVARAASGGTARPPGGATYVLWAGEIGAGRLVLLQGVDRDGTPLVAQVSEQGDPARLELDLVEEVPPGDHVVVAVTYNGNLNLPQLSPGADSGLIQLLEAPSGSRDLRTLWRQDGDAEDDVLEPLESRDGAMSQTFLHIGGVDEPGTAVVVAEAVGGRAGVIGTVEVRPGRLFPGAAPVVLLDNEAWGPSGRIDGTEYLDALVAAELVGLDTARVHELAAGAAEVDGAEVVAHLFEVVGVDGVGRIALVVREPRAVVLCTAHGLTVTTGGSTESSPPAAGTSPPASSTGALHSDDLLAFARCADPQRTVVVTAAATGAGAVEMRVGSDPVAEPADRVVVIEPYGAGAASGPIDVSLVDDPAVRVTLPALP